KRPCNITPPRAHLRCGITAGGCRPTAQPQDGSPRATAQQTPVQHHSTTRAPAPRNHSLGLPPNRSWTTDFPSVEYLYGLGA
ncbi:MAG: hypothetical protein ACKO2P_10875, partial [Planctomycetota bacterium]